MLWCLLSVVLWCGTLWCAAVAQPSASPSRLTVTGLVVDSLTGQRLEFITIQEKGKANGTITNTDGSFALTVNAGSAVVFSCVGYRTKEVTAAGRTKNLTVQLCPTDYELGEVVVKPRREHYRRRDNPSVALAKQVIAHKGDRLPQQRHDYFSQERYDRMTYSFNNFDGAMRAAWEKKFPFIGQYVDTATLSGSPILPVSTDEHIEVDYYRRSPRSHKTLLAADRHAGFDDMLPPEILGAMRSDIFPEIDLHDDNIYLFTNKFVSPISQFAPAFYKFYILDTLTWDDGRRYIDLGFAPLVPESFGFVGHLYVTTDSTYFLRRAELNVPKDINLNFVRSMRIVVDQDRLADSTQVVRLKTFESEMNVFENTMGLYAQRTSAYSGFSTEPPADAAVFAQMGPVIEHPDRARRDDAFWSHHTGEAVASTSRRSGVAAMLEDMRQVKFFYYTEQVLTALFKGYISIGRQPYEENKFLYGPLNTSISYNAFEGIRLRTGGITTARLHPRLFGFGYVAYGCHDHEWKYDAALEWSFKDKKMHANEFPVHSLRFDYQYDTRLLGQEPTTSKDNFLLSLRRSSDDQITYQRRAAAVYTHEWWNNFSLKLGLEHTRDYATSFTPLRHAGSGRPVPHFDMTTAALTLRYAPGEKFMQSRTSRIPLNKEAPVFTLTHEAASRHVGSDFDYMRTDVKFNKRWWLGAAFGYADVTLKAGQVWTQSPFPMLCLPNANTALTIQDESFSQMRAMEFVNDRYASWDVVYFLNGFVFNSIPLLRRLKWREVVTFRGLWGDLSERNDPEALLPDGVTLRNPNLYAFPETSDGIKRASYRMASVPYMEFALGVENILKVLRIDYIRRLNYLDRPGVHPHGVQVTMHLTF